MIQRCSNCGAPAPDDGSVFCNRCGARLPITACRKCGKTVTDPQSRFCDRCGSPLAPAVQGAVPPITLQKGRICLSCGFENFIEDASFCKKCGTTLGKSGDPRAVPDSRARERAAGTSADTRSAVRREPVGIPVAPPPQPLSSPAVLRQKPAVVPGDMQGIPQDRPDEYRKNNRWSYRKIALFAVVIILIIIGIAAVLAFAPKIFGGNSANATVPDANGTAPEAKTIVSDTTTIVPDTVTTVPEDANALSPGTIDTQEPVINQDVPVFIDTTLSIRGP
jgi:ribosomal protein L40E